VSTISREFARHIYAPSNLARTHNTISRSSQPPSRCISLLLSKHKTWHPSQLPLKSSTSAVPPPSHLHHPANLLPRAKIAVQVAKLRRLVKLPRYAQNRFAVLLAEPPSTPSPVPRIYAFPALYPPEYSLPRAKIAVQVANLRIRELKTRTAVPSYSPDNSLSTSHNHPLPHAQ
jgi:hypothetical protein